jgi:double-stranded uracil-DNA glycosylase
LSSDEYRAGLERLDALCRWLRPGVVCVVGLTGWRAATGDRHAAAGLQDRDLGGRPVYLMPNPSGLNAHTNVEDLAQHLRAAGAVADGETGREHAGPGRT